MPVLHYVYNNNILTTELECLSSNVHCYTKLQKASYIGGKRALSASLLLNLLRTGQGLVLLYILVYKCGVRLLPWFDLVCVYSHVRHLWPEEMFQLTRAKRGQKRKENLTLVEK